MLRSCRVYYAMSLPMACRVMNFSEPPRHRRQLRQRYLTLTKERHPDSVHGQGARGKHVTDATAAMIRLTDAYRVLQAHLRQSGRCVHRSSTNNNNNDNAEDEAADVSFLHRHTRRTHASHNNVNGDNNSDGSDHSQADRLYPSVWVSAAAHRVRLPWQRRCTHNSMQSQQQKQHHHHQQQQRHRDNSESDPMHYASARDGASDSSRRSGEAHPHREYGAECKINKQQMQCAWVLYKGIQQWRRRQQWWRRTRVPLCCKSEQGGGDGVGQRVRRMSSWRCVVSEFREVSRWYRRRVASWLRSAPHKVWHALRYIVSP